MDIFENVKKLCVQNGITQKELEETLGLGKKSLQNWKNHLPALENVIAVANYFRVPLDYLCDREIQTVFLTNEERDFISAYRSMNEEGKRSVRIMVEALAKENLYKKSDMVQEA